MTFPQRARQLESDLGTAIIVLQSGSKTEFMFFFYQQFGLTFPLSLPNKILEGIPTFITYSIVTASTQPQIKLTVSK
jgi:hypothetical protein